MVLAAEGPVLAVLAMLAKGAARGSGWLRSSLPLRCAPRLRCSRPGRESRHISRTGKPDRGDLPRARGTFLFGGTRGHFYFALTESFLHVLAPNRNVPFVQS
jgi:hypothetical protein